MRDISCSSVADRSTAKVIQSRIQIYLLSRDRPNYFSQALDSLIVGSDGLADIIVSDNSEADAIQGIVTSQYQTIHYVRRNPSLSALEHFRAVIEESSAEFLVLFHDDDIMMPSYAKTMLDALDNNPALAAVGCNALVLRGDKKTLKPFMGSTNKPRLISCHDMFLQPYLAFSSYVPAPFPGYMYRRKYLAGLYLDGAHGGKHSDVTFLTKIISRGPILWLPQPLMWYRVHADNDSNSESIGDRLSLLRYLRKHGWIDLKSSAVREFKFRYWASWWLQRSRNGLPKSFWSWRDRIVLKFLLRTGARFALTKPILWQKLINRFLR